MNKREWTGTQTHPHHMTLDMHMHIRGMHAPQHGDSSLYLVDLISISAFGRGGVPLLAYGQAAVTPRSGRTGSQIHPPSLPRGSVNLNAKLQSDRLPGCLRGGANGARRRR